MEAHPHHQRTVRLLESRLESLAAVSERLPSAPRPLDRRVLALEAATQHAVELELLSREEAGAIWAAVARRHPLARWCQAGPSLAA